MVEIKRLRVRYRIHKLKEQRSWVTLKQLLVNLVPLSIKDELNKI